MAQRFEFLLSAFLALLFPWLAFSQFPPIPGVPTPVITLHDGHIGMQDQLMTTDYSGAIYVGNPYTLDIYMADTQQYDYVIDRCVYNTRVSFLDNYGCLRRDDVFLEKWESNQYTIPGSIKRTLVYFVANEPVADFQCQIKVIQCCGCAEASCERQPLVSYYPTYDVPLMCSYPPQQPYFPLNGNNNNYYYGDYLSTIPWWMWLLLLLLLLLLLCLLVCAVAFCIMRRRRVTVAPARDERKQYVFSTADQTLRRNQEMSEYQGAPPPPIIAPKPVKLQQKSVQTPSNDELFNNRTQHNPDLTEQYNRIQPNSEERYSRRQQSDLAEQSHNGTSSSRRFTSSEHAAIPLRNYHPRNERQREKTIKHTIYDVGDESERTSYALGRSHSYPGHFHQPVEEHYEEETIEQIEEQRSRYFNNSNGQQSTARDQRIVKSYGGVPVYRTNNYRQQEQLQREIEERMLREQERHRLERQIESHLAEHREQQEHSTSYKSSPSTEAVREETIRTIRQSSVI